MFSKGRDYPVRPCSYLNKSIRGMLVKLLRYMSVKSINNIMSYRKTKITNSNMKEVKSVSHEYMDKSESKNRIKQNYIYIFKINYIIWILPTQYTIRTIIRCVPLLCSIIIEHYHRAQYRQSKPKNIVWTGNTLKTTKRALVNGFNI